MNDSINVLQGGTLMEFYTVKEIAEMLSVNEETVRRWIRENKLDAERGVGRQGSKVSTESLKNFLNENKGLITNSATSILGIGTATSVGVAANSLGSSGGIIGSIFSIAASAIEAISWGGILNENDKDKKQISVELMEKELELEKIAMQLKNEIAFKRNELELVKSQIAKLKELKNKQKSLEE